MVPALIGIGITLLVTNAANLYALHKLHNKVVAKNMDLETKPNLGMLSDALMTNLVIALGIGIVAAAFFFAPPSVVLVAAALISILPLINSHFVLNKHAKIIADKVHKTFDKSPLELKSSEHFDIENLEPEVPFQYGSEFDTLLSSSIEMSSYKTLQRQLQMQ